MTGYLFSVADTPVFYTFKSHISILLLHAFIPLHSRIALYTEFQLAGPRTAGALSNAPQLHDRGTNKIQLSYSFCPVYTKIILFSLCSAACEGICRNTWNTGFCVDTENGLSESRSDEFDVFCIVFSKVLYFLVFPDS